MIQIVPVETPAQRKTFMMLPWKIYKNDPKWVPPLLMDLKKMFNPAKHPFYEYGTMKLFLAYKNNELQGRIAAITNDRFDHYHPRENGKTGFFGFFESVNDQEVANALLDRAKTYLQEIGMAFMNGPASPSSNYEFGALSEGFDDAPRVMMSYNPSYYIKLYENYGLNLVKTLYAYKIDADTVFNNEKLKRGAELVKKRYNVELRPINMKDLKSEVQKVKDIYNRAWELNWGYVPLTDKEIDVMAEELKMTAEPKLMPFVYVNGQLAGMAIATLDFNLLLKKINGRLFPFGIFTLLTQKKRIKWMRIILLGLLPEFRGKGLDAPLYYELVKNGLELGLTHAEGSWILEDNVEMNRGMEVVSAKIYKKYQVFEIEL